MIPQWHPTFWPLYPRQVPPPRQFLSATGCVATPRRCRLGLRSMGFGRSIRSIRLAAFHRQPGCQDVVGRSQNSVDAMNFKYFQGPREDMAEFCLEPEVCSLCNSLGECFRLESAICPALSDTKRTAAHGCYSCLKAGRFEFWHDTDIGVLDSDGLTGVYNHNKRPPPAFPQAALLELRRTPQILTWQQELWLTHCNDFMAYLGTWEPKDFYVHAPDGDGRSLFVKMTDEFDHLWDESLREGQERLIAWHATYYVFRCLHCGELRGNWDCD
jgi:hypothetical protein